MRRFTSHVFLLALVAGLSWTAGVQARVIPNSPPDPTGDLRILGRLIVNFKAGSRPSRDKSRQNSAVMGIDAVDQINTRYGLKDFRPLFPPMRPTKVPRNAPDLDGYYVLNFDPAVDLDRAAADYQSDPNVDKVEYDSYAYIMRTPNDPMFPGAPGVGQWDLNQFNDVDIDCPEAWDNTVGSPTTILADTDTGQLWWHEDLINSIWVNPGEDLNHNGVVMDPADMNGIDDDSNGYVDDLIGWDFVSAGSNVWPGEDGSVEDNDPKDFNGHGTHTGGTIAATTNNGVGVAGIAGGFSPITERGCRLMCLRMGYSYNNAGTEGGVTQMSYVAEAFRYAADNGAVAINYSFESSNDGGIDAATDYAVAAGLVIVAAAGNSGNNTSFGYLQLRPDVLCVASTNSGDGLSSFSNYGGPVDICAPGSNIISTVSNHYVPGYAIYNGTSMAAPHVVGLVGLLRSMNPALTRQEVFDLIESTADNIDAENPTRIGQLGAGRINANSATSIPASTNFAGTPLVGQAPLQVQFSDSSRTAPTTWAWDFGDGDNSTEQNPLHTYNPGLYNVTLSTQTAIGNGYKLKTNYVVALAETLSAVDAQAPQDALGYVVLSATNNQAVSDMILPIACSNVPGTATLDSISTVGCRTSYFGNQQVVYDNRGVGKMAVRLRADTSSGHGAPPLAPGSGPIARVWLHVQPGANPGAPVKVDTARLGSQPYVLQFISPVVSFVPVFHSGTMDVKVTPGDIDYNGVLDIVDVVAEVNYVFRGQALPNPPDRVDVNCDGTYNIVDVIKLIDAAFRGGPTPSCP
ncbi:MAG: S8 family serine peptidase [candidate division Zixibacteria bacterium]|nr:S8 family serine peptidase [candidate division Zixibacteria bacterium]